MPSDPSPCHLTLLWILTLVHDAAMYLAGVVIVGVAIVACAVSRCIRPPNYGRISTR